MTVFVDGQQLSAADLNNNLPPIGCVVAYGGPTSPNAEWGLLDGSALARTGDYATLFARIGTAFGAGDGLTTFNIPDGRGRMIIGIGTLAWATAFLFSDVDTTANTIAVASNNTLYTGQKVRFTTTGGLPAPLSAGVDYYVIRISATSIKLATSRDNALGSSGSGSTGTITAIDITTQGTGTHTLTVQDLSTRTMGEVGGEETHAISITEMPSHVHTGGVSGADANDASLNSNTINIPTGATGGSTPHNVMNPYLGMNWLMKLK
mgnify:CR=1 FL=1